MMIDVIELGSRVRRLFCGVIGEVVEIDSDGLAHIEWPDGSLSTTPVCKVYVIDDDDRLIDHTPVGVGAFVRRLYGCDVGRVTAVHGDVLDVEWAGHVVTVLAGDNPEGAGVKAIDDVKTMLIESVLIDRLARRLDQTARNEVDRLVLMGWVREDAALFVEFSPSWPFANERDAPPGIMQPEAMP